MSNNGQSDDMSRLTNSTYSTQEEGDENKEKENDIIINEKDEEKEDTKLNNSLSEDSSNCDTTNDSIKEGEKTDDQDGEKHIKKLFQFLDNNDVNPLLGGRVINWQEFFLMRLNKNTSPKP